MSTIRPYQLCIYGATGFTGKLVCERLATEYPNTLRLAVAGRDRAKLETLKQEMLQFTSSFEDVGVLVADKDDVSAVDAMTQSTEVLISCAGPYNKYSESVVASSVKNKTHYLDLSAEVAWIQHNIKRYHDQALEDGTKIVHFCGFDSVPMDLGTLLMVDTIRKKYNCGCRLVEQYIVSAFGGVSGGTSATLLDIMDSPDQEAVNDPKALCPENLNKRSGETFEGSRYNADINAWMISSFFSEVNVPVVLRSNALAKLPYGRDFKYREGFKADNFISASFVNAFSGATELVKNSPFLRGALRLIIPKSGSGPSTLVQRRVGFWKILLVGYPEDAPESEDPSSKAYTCIRIEDNSADPGYWSASKMLLECALSLLLEKEHVDASAALKGGVLTPALAFGVLPLERLRRSGFIIEIDN